METILVTGGLGFVGSHTCVKLLENNYNIVIVDSLINSSRDILDKIKEIFNLKGVKVNHKIQFIEGDLRDRFFLENVFNSYSKTDRPIKFVLHFAGLKSIYASIKMPIEYWDANVSSTISLLSIMKKYHCFSLIFSSSASVYQSKGQNLLKETDVLKPITPYGKTKLCIEEILRDLSECEECWRIANLRFFNPVGSHNSGLLTESSKNNSSNLFPEIIKTIKGKQKTILIFGKDWPTCDGTCIRDFIHVMDLAEAHIATLNYLQNNKPQNIAINIGTGKGTSILEIIKTFRKIQGIKLSYEFTERRMGDQPFLVADNKRALQLLDWFPKREISEMCSDSVINL